MCIRDRSGSEEGAATTTISASVLDSASDTAASPDAANRGSRWIMDASYRDQAEGGVPLEPGALVEFDRRFVRLVDVERHEPVSYTHLTLPTSGVV